MSVGLAQGPYMAARVGFEPAILRTQGIKVTTEPKRQSLSTLYISLDDNIKMHKIHAVIFEDVP